MTRELRSFVDRVLAPRREERFAHGFGLRHRRERVRPQGIEAEYVLLIAGVEVHEPLPLPARERDGVRVPPEATLEVANDRRRVGLRDEVVHEAEQHPRLAGSGRTDRPRPRLHDFLGEAEPSEVVGVAPHRR